MSFPEKGSTISSSSLTENEVNLLSEKENENAFLKKELEKEKEKVHHLKVEKKSYIFLTITILIVCFFLVLCGSLTLIPQGENISGNDAFVAHEVVKAMEPNNSDVRDFALYSISPTNGGKFNISQVCDIFDELYALWTIVEDPNTNQDYYAKAGESINLLKGDCDDFAILISSCIQAIGGTPRIIFAFNENGNGHAYAEVLLGTDYEDVMDKIREIRNRYGGDFVHYHKSYDKEGNQTYWLNLDWSQNHPGGKFFNNSGKILVIYPNGTYTREDFSPENTY